jgi:S-adenosylmethionine-diacylglycerol 3-amino-3-carboxypropyl transferase
MPFQNHILQALSWDQLDYSQEWEDARLLRKSLQIKPEDHVVTVGSAGCNVLELLLENPKKITVIDLNPTQHALLDLRLRSIEKLDYISYLILLGIVPSHRAISLYRSLRPSLLPATRNYFDANEQLISQGLIHQGRLEKYFAYFRSEALWQVWSEGFRQHLISATKLSEQTALIYRQGRLEELKALSQKFFDRYFSPQATQNNIDISLGDVLFVKLLHVLQTQLIRDNPYLYYFITGEVPPENQRIDSLKESAFPILKTRLSRVELVSSDLETALSHLPSGGVQKLNLSHLFESFEPDYCDNLFARLHEKMSPHGKLAYWTSSADRTPSRLQFQQAKPMTVPDRVWFYKDYFIFEKK